MVFRISPHMSSHPALLAATDLEARRGRRSLFRALSFALEPGRALLVSGRNGSGKTTLLRTLCGLTRPERGVVSWRGRPIGAQRDEYNAELVYLGHASALKDDLTAEENLVTSMSLSVRIGAGEARRALAEAGLDSCARLPAKLLSQGQRRRVALTRLCLARARPLWILDEPFVGLDAEAADALRNLLAAHLDAGGSLVFTTHQEIEIAPDRTTRVALDS